MNIKQLKAELKKYDLPSSGNKPQLMSLLKSAQQINSVQHQSLATQLTTSIHQQSCIPITSQLSTELICLIDRTTNCNLAFTRSHVGSRSSSCLWLILPSSMHLHSPAILTPPVNCFLCVMPLLMSCTTDLVPDIVSTLAGCYVIVLDCQF